VREFGSIERRSRIEADANPWAGSPGMAPYAMPDKPINYFQPIAAMTIAVLMTCHNRRELTLNCLSCLARATLPEGSKVEVTLVDDGSSDGTGEQVAARFPSVEVIRGDGNLYWCGGMREAWKHAAKTDPDYYVFLNDDVALALNAMVELIGSAGSPAARRIIVGAMRDPVSGRVTYGGRFGRKGDDLREPAGHPEVCTTMNANLTLVTRAVYQEMGMFYEGFSHGLGDYDYGFQAVRRGIEVIQSACFLGSCARNSTQGTFLDRSLPRRRRFQLIMQPKGLPWRAWVAYNRRNSGWLWAYHSIAPYLRIVLGR